MAQMTSSGTQQQEAPLKRYVAILFRYKYAILAIFIIGTALGVSGSYYLVYPMSVWDGKRMIILPSPQREIQTLMEEEARGFNTRSLNLTAEIARLRDDTILREVVKQCNLVELEKRIQADLEKSPQGRFQKWIDENLSTIVPKEEEFVPEKERMLHAAVGRLESNLKITPAETGRRRRGENPLLSVTYSNIERKKVAEVLNKFIETCKEHRKAAFESNDLLKRRNELFQKRFLQIQNNFQEKKETLQSHYKALDLPFGADVNSLVMSLGQRVLQLESRENELQSDIRQANSRVNYLTAELEAMKQTTSTRPTREIPDNSPEARSLSQQLNAIDSEITELTRELWSGQTPESRKAVIKKDLAKLEEKRKSCYAELDKLKETEEIRDPEVMRVKRQLELQKGSLASLQSDLEAVRQSLSKQREKLKNLRSKVAQLTLAKNEFEQGRDRYEQAKIQKERRDIYKTARSRVELLEAVGSEPEVSTTTRSLDKLGRRKIVMVVSLGSLAAGLGLAFLLGMVLDSSFHAPLEAETALKVPVLAAVPETRRARRF